jgi:hypothetical protein
LILSAGAMTLGRTGSETSPGIENYSPSGTRAFAELLRNRGYVPRSERNPSPRIRKDEVAIAFSPTPEMFLLTGEEKESKVITAFKKYVQDGGRGIHLQKTKSGWSPIRVKCSRLDFGRHAARKCS